MTNWIETTLGKIIELQRGYDLTEQERSPGTVPVIGSAGQNGWHDHARAKGPGVTIGRSGASIGAVTLTKSDYWPHNTVLYVKDFKGNDPPFVANLLRGINLAGLNSGSAQPSLNRNFVYPIKVTIPDPTGQRRIADVLSAYDDLIEVNQRRIAVLEEMARRLFDEWFVHFRYPGHEGDRLVETELGSAPRGWSVCPLENECSRITDGSHWSPASQLTGKPMASVKDMRTWGFETANFRRIPEEDFTALVRNDCMPRVGDILIAKDGANLNKHTFLITEAADLVILSSIAILRPKKGVNAEFLTAMLKSNEVSARIKQSVSGAAIPRIILTDFKKLPILVPPTTLQNEWGMRFGPVAQQCRKLSYQNTRLRAARDLLLPKLISGEIEVGRAEAVWPEAAE